MKQKEEARLKAQEKIIKEFESDCSSKNRMEIDEETKEEGLNRFFQSQGGEEAPPTLKPDEPPKMINSSPPAASNDWNKIAEYQSTGSSKARAFSTNYGRSESQGKTGNPTRTKHGVYSECPFCKGDHNLDECNHFKCEPMNERKSFFFQRMLCLGCGMTDLHQIKDYPDRKICKECKGQHLTCFHYPTRPIAARDEGTARCTTVCSLPEQTAETIV